MTRIEAAGVRYNRETAEVDKSQLLSNLQQDFVSIIEALGEEEDGILLLIDEADKPETDADLGLICKLVTEELSKRGSERLCIGLAGLPGILDKLRDSHESSLRIFHVLDLKPLELDERLQVLERGLQEACEKNGFEISITDDGKTLIATLCEGYPHFLQEFAYCAYEEDNDNTIDVDDIVRSLFSENGAFDQLGKKYFDKFYSAVSSDKYRDVLNAMAKHHDEWVSRKTLIEETGLSDGTVDNALRALKDKDVIVHSTLRQGEYRLPTRSFAVWINAIKLAQVRASKSEPGLFTEE